MFSPNETPRSRGSHISRNAAAVRSTLPRPVSPFCFSVGARSGNSARKLSGKCQPEGGGVHLLLGHREVARADVLVRVELDLLEADDLPVHAHVAVGRARARERRGIELLEHLDLRVVDGVGVVIALDAAHVSLAPFVVELLHLVLPRLVQVDGLLVQRGEGGGEIDFGDHLRLAGGIDDDEVVAGDRAQADGVGGVGVRGPVPGVGGVVQQAQLVEERAQLRRIVAAELLAVADGQLEGGALQVVDAGSRRCRG